MKKILFIIFAVIFFSCKNTPEEKIVETTQLSKLEQLKKHRSDVPLDYVDLSNENLTQMPYLGDYTIKSLDLSHNKIEKLIWVFLPKGIQKLNISYNSLTSIQGYENIDFPIEELNVANNRITYISSYTPIKKLIAMNNNIEEINIKFLSSTLNYIPNLDDR